MSLELVAGSENNDSFNASALSYGVTLVGLGGADTLTGSNFADAIYFDNLDTVTGGSGYDWAYAINSAAVNLNLGARGFEGATGTASADTFDASGVTDLAGAQIFAGAGDDTIVNSAMADLFVGEADFDTVVYAGINSASASIGNAGGGTFIVTIGGVSDVLVGIEKLTFANTDIFL